MKQIKRKERPVDIGDAHGPLKKLAGTKGMKLGALARKLILEGLKAEGVK